MRLLPSLARRSRFLFDFDAAHCVSAVDQVLDARSGQAATISRPSSKIVRDANGVLVTALGGMPSFEWATDPVSGLNVPGLALEVPSANNMLWNRDLTNGVWTKSGTTAQANIGTAPDGTLDMDILTETAANSEHYAQQSGAGWNNNDVAALSVDIRPYAAGGAPIRNFYLSVVQKDGSTVLGAFFNPSNGTVVSAAAGVTAEIETMPGVSSCYRVKISVSVGTGASQPAMRIQCASGTTLVYAGNTSSGVAVWAMQMEGGAYTTSRMPSTNATVTRTVDALSFTVNIPPRALTMYARFVNRGTGKNVNADAGILDLGGNGGTPRFILYHNTTGWISNHSGGSIAGAVQAVAYGDLIEMRGVLNADGSVVVGVSVNGAAEVTSFDNTAPGLESAWAATTLTVNKYAAGTPGNATFQKVRIASGAQSLSFMQQG